MRRFLSILILTFLLVLPCNSEAASKIYGYTSLTGGTTGALDAIDGALLNDKDMALGAESGKYYFYILDADSGLTASSPVIISPATNAGLKRWIVQEGLYLPGQTAGDIMYFNGAEWTRLPKDVGKYLKSGSSSVSWGDVAASTTHNILSATHVDSVEHAVVAGDMLYGNSTPVWDRLPIGLVGKISRSTGSAPSWSTLTMPDTIAAGTVFGANTSNVLAPITSTSGIKRLQNKTGVISWEAEHFIDVKQFGAVGDGVANDYTAIQAAIDYVNSLPYGALLIFPPGNYLTSATLTWTITADKAISVSGYGARIGRYGSFTGNLAYIGANAGVAVIPGYIRGLIFYGPYLTPTVDSLVKTKWANGFDFHDCVFWAGTKGLELETSYAVRVMNSKFFYQQHYGIISTTSCMNLLVSGCQFGSIGVKADGTTPSTAHDGTYDYGNYTTGVWAGSTAGVGSDIYLSGTTYNIKILDNDMEGGVSAFNMTAGGGSITFKGNYVELKYNTNPIYFGSSVTGVDISGNWIGWGVGNQTWYYVNGGNLTNNTFYSLGQTVTSGGGTECIAFDVSHNQYLGTSCTNIDGIDGIQMKQDAAGSVISYDSGAWTSYAIGTPGTTGTYGWNIGNASAMSLTGTQLTVPSIKITSGAGTGKVLVSDSVGQGAWTTAAGFDLVNDTTPQLGGPLDMNAQYFTGTQVGTTGNYLVQATGVAAVGHYNTLAATGGTNGIGVVSAEYQLGASIISMWHDGTMGRLTTTAGSLYLIPANNGSGYYYTVVSGTPASASFANILLVEGGANGVGHVQAEYQQGGRVVDISHNNTDGVITTTYGGLSLTPTNSTTSITGTLAVTSTISATGGNSTNWNTAYGWGNHASAGYLTTVHGSVTDNLNYDVNSYSAFAGKTYGWYANGSAVMWVTDTGFGANIGGTLRTLSVGDANSCGAARCVTAPN